MGAAWQDRLRVLGSELVRPDREIWAIRDVVDVGWKGLLHDRWHLSMRQTHVPLPLRVELGLNQLQVGDTALVNRLLGEGPDLLKVAFVVEVTDLDRRFYWSKPVNGDHPSFGTQVDPPLLVVERQRSSPVHSIPVRTS